LEDLGVDGRIMLEWVSKEQVWEVVDWIHWVQDQGHCVIL